jgi:hypothetical protein
MVYSSVKHFEDETEMAKFLRIAAYTFLAFSGMYAWLSMQTGWRHYLGLGIFFFASVRIMVLIFPKKSGGKPAVEAPQDTKNKSDC